MAIIIDFQNIESPVLIKMKHQLYTQGMREVFKYIILFIFLHDYECGIGVVNL